MVHGSLEQLPLHNRYRLTDQDPFLLNISCHDFEKVDEGRKLSSQLWVRMAGYKNYIKYAGRKLKNLMWLRIAGYQKYISYRYVFISYFVSLKKYAGRKLKNLMWLHMAGYLNYV